MNNILSRGLRGFNGFSYKFDIKKRVLSDIKDMVKKEMTLQYLSSIKTEKGNTQNAERNYIKKMKDILDNLGYSYKEASSQQPKDFRNIQNIGLDIEMKKTDSFNVYFNDTLPTKDTEYIILYTGGKKYKAQTIHVNGLYFIDSSKDWIYDYIREIEVIKNKYCRGPYAKKLSGCMSVYCRPTYKATIKDILDN